METVKSLLMLWFFALSLISSQKTLPNKELNPQSIVPIIDEWNAHLSPSNRTAKYCKMLASPFVFYRGTNHLFWADFSDDSRLKQFSTEQTKIWLQGDLHAENFGSYDNNKGQIVYDLNDFDESIIADYQFDVWRMAISLILIARQNNNLTLSEQEAALDAFAESYLDTLASYRGNDNEINLIFTKDNTYGKLDDFLDDVEKGVKNNKSRLEMLDDWTIEKGNERYFDLSSNKLEATTQQEETDIINAMTAYGTTLSGGLDYDTNYFAVKDVARRLLAGTGSLGTPRYYVLIEGKSNNPDDDRILDVKQQSKPSPYYFLDTITKTNYDSQFTNDAQRHAIAYLALTTHTDDHLGWMTLENGVYSVRERSPYKDAFPTDKLNSETRFTKLATQWGTILATNHARSDKDYDPSLIDYSFDKNVDVITDRHHAEFRELVKEVAFDYANQVYFDWVEFKVAYTHLNCK